MYLILVFKDFEDSLRPNGWEGSLHTVTSKLTVFAIDITSYVV
jgi:hypothetical protein